MKPWWSNVYSFNSSTGASGHVMSSVWMIIVLLWFPYATRSDGHISRLHPMQICGRLHLYDLKTILPNCTQRRVYGPVWVLGRCSVAWTQVRIYEVLPGKLNVGKHTYSSHVAPVTVSVSTVSWYLTWSTTTQTVNGEARLDQASSTQIKKF